MNPWFDDPVLGKMPLEEAVIKLRELGEDETASLLVQSEISRLFEDTLVDDRGLMKGSTNWWSVQGRPWQHTGHAFGYLAPAAPGNAPLPIHAIGNIPADLALKRTRIKISLSRLRAVSYPGGGMHRALLHFSAQNQLLGSAENVHFNATYRVWDGDHAGVQGYPIFVGLCVGNEGISLRCRTINVSNDQDEAFLDFLESGVFKAGLKLATTAQPIIAPFSEMALGLARVIAKRHRNVAVQDFDLGLDFGNDPMGGRLAEGNYLAVQIPESLQPIWNWDEWVYHPALAQVVKRSDQQQTIPYNYLVFNISHYEGK